MKTPVPLVFCLLASPVFAQSPGNASDPAELKSLRSRWETARANAVAPIDKRYLTELEALRNRFRREGKLADAERVANEIALQNKEEPERAADALRAVLTANSFRWFDGTPMKFLPNGKIECKYFFIASWKVREDGVLQVHQNNADRYWTFRFNEDHSRAVSTKEPGSIQDDKTITRGLGSSPASGLRPAE